MKVKGFEQLRLHDVDWSYYDNRTGNKWAGKVVDKVGFVGRGDTDDQTLIILFTDKTFICVGCEYEQDENGRERLNLKDKWIHDQSVYHGNQLEIYHTWVNKEGEISFDLWVQMLIDMGFWKLSPEEAQKIREEHFKKEEDREWQNYLRLKEKFKDRIENEKDTI